MTAKRTKSFIITLMIIMGIMALFTTAAWAGDPTGAGSAGINSITAEKAGAPTLQEVAADLGKTKIGLNFVWVILCGCLIFFFQAGFALVETGFTQAKNAMHTMAMNLMVFLVGTIGFFVAGFAFMFGGVGAVSALGGTAPLDGVLSIGGWNLLGLKGFFLTSGGSYDVGVFAMFFFQMVFMDTTVTIPTGSMAERVKFSAVVIASFFISIIAYPFYGNWVWGGGWLAQIGSKLGLGHGVVDFAGSGVVHAMGGALALAGAIVLGPRIGKFKKDGTPVAIPGHDIPIAILGTIILFFGWFVFNAGSTLNGSDLRLAVVATNTMIAGAFGGFTAMIYMWVRYGKPDPSMMCNGALAGLVAITAPCAFVTGLSAAIIGIVAGILVCLAVYFIEHKLKVDDPVGAVAVHFVNGCWGLIAVGLFADGTYGDGLNGVAGGVTGLLYGGGFSQLAAQLIAVAVIFTWGTVGGFIFYKVLDMVMGIRVPEHDEINGLDIPEMGVKAYPDFVLTAAHTVAAAKAAAPVMTAVQPEPKGMNLASH